MTKAGALPSVAGSFYDATENHVLVVKWQRASLAKMEDYHEIKYPKRNQAQIIRAGYTMQEVVDQLHDEYGWSDSVSNLSGKLQRESLRYREAVELADVLGYDIVWQKRRD